MINKPKPITRKEYASQWWYNDFVVTGSIIIAVVVFVFALIMALYASARAQCYYGDAVGFVKVSSVTDDKKWLPDRHRTPGASAGATAADTAKLCDPKFFTASVRHVTQGEKCGVFHTYGIQCDQCDKNAKLKCGSFEIDHLISLELGGTNDPANLWPEPYNGVCGAHVKDGLETHLASEVCKGHITLSDAQKAISSNWIKAYRQYVDATLSCE